MNVIPISLPAANDFIEIHHRHHKKVRGHKFSCAIKNADDIIIAVIIAGRPVARKLDDGLTLELLRICTSPGVLKNAVSKLIGCVRRAAKALGYKKLVTYILFSETGTSLVAPGFKMKRITRGGSWNCPSRPRTDKSPTCKKKYWEILL